MSTVINKNIVLVLKADEFVPISYISVRKALKSMYSDGVDAVQALNTTYPLKEDGTPDYDAAPYFDIVGIDEWINLPVRPYDCVVHTPHKDIRAPIVVVTHNCKKVPRKQLKPTRRNLWEFYKKRCIWTNKEISYSECTKEHLVPKSHGKDDSWLNLAPASRKINNERGNIPLDKWKYKPQYKIIEPPKMPVSTLIRHAAHPEWKYWLIAKEKC